MPQYVLEFGAAELVPVVEVLVSLMGSPDIIEVAANQPDGPKYGRTAEELSKVVDDLRDGRLMSAILRSQAPDVRYGLIIRPHFFGQQLSLWMGTIESTSPDWKPMWRAVLSNDQLRFACIGSEEGVELSDDRLSVDTFPWQEWPMIIGALRSGGGSWVIKENATQAP